MPIGTRASNATKRPGLIAKSGTTIRRSSAEVAKDKDEKARAKEEKKRKKDELELTKAHLLERVTLDATVEDAAYATPVPQRVAAQRKPPGRVLQRTESTLNVFEDNQGAIDDAASMPPPNGPPSLKRKNVVMSSAAGRELATSVATPTEAAVSPMSIPREGAADEAVKAAQVFVYRRLWRCTSSPVTVHVKQA